MTDVTFRDNSGVIREAAVRQAVGDLPAARGAGEDRRAWQRRDLQVDAVREASEPEHALHQAAVRARRNLSSATSPATSRTRRAGSSSRTSTSCANADLQPWCRRASAASSRRSADGFQAREVERREHRRRAVLRDGATRERLAGFLHCRGSRRAPPPAPEPVARAFSKRPSARLCRSSHACTPLAVQARRGRSARARSPPPARTPWATPRRTRRGRAGVGRLCAPIGASASRWPTMVYRRAYAETATSSGGSSATEPPPGGRTMRTDD